MSHKRSILARQDGPAKQKTPESDLGAYELSGDEMKKAGALLCGAIAVTVLFSGCQATGEQYAANVYQANQVNARQAARTVRILAVMPAKVQVDNRQAKQAAQIFAGILGAVAGGAIGHSIGNRDASNTTLGAVTGGVAGAAAGSMVGSQTLVDGVSITYVQDGQTYNSAQVGALCQFAPGEAVMISTGPNETRIQPNAICPIAKK